MSRNGSGVYSLPGTYQAVSGETIEAQQHNDPLEDLQSDANGARPIVAGGTGATTAAGARTNLSVSIAAKGADVASANALTLGSDGNYFDITGTTAITSIATKGAGTVVKLHFDGVLTLTYDATALILPGAVDITTAAGDEAEFVEYATGDWRCISYQRAAQSPISPQLGQCELSYTDATHVALNRQNGSIININSSQYVIPSGGVSATNSGLSTDTLYYVYAYMNSGTMTLEFSATAYATHTDGTQIKSGDATRALVGMVQTDGSSQFNDSATNRGVLSWFNRKPIHCAASTSSDTTPITSSTFTVVSSTSISFLTWGDVPTSIDAQACVNNDAGGTQGTGIAIDGSVVGGQISSSITSGANVPHSMSYRAALNEGYHTARIGLKTSTGNAYLLGTVSPIQINAVVFG